MLRLILGEKITTLFEAEQHVYSIPAAGQMPSSSWTSLTHERRHGLRSRAVSLWKEYFESDGRTIAHPPIVIPEYRQMLTHPDGDLIVEEL
jgi:hypothetical protein